MTAFLWPGQVSGETGVGRAINRWYLADESAVVRELLPMARLERSASERVVREAVELVDSVRRRRKGTAGIEAFLQQYDLGSREGVILMCIAEALLRIPDADTADGLIADRIGAGRWAEHLGAADSLFVNASTWGLMLTGRIVRLDPKDVAAPAGAMARMAGRAARHSIDPRLPVVQNSPPIKSDWPPYCRNSAGKPQCP